MVIDDKRRLRLEMKEILSFIPQKPERSEGLVCALLHKKIFDGVKTISIFITLDDEVDTLPIVEYCWEQGITVTVPEFLQSSGYLLRKWQKADRLFETQYGIFHPKNSKTYPVDKIDLIFVPGMAFSADGKRLGRGKGFYDRLLAQYKGKKVGLCFREQIKQDIPVGEHDVKVDQVVTC